MEGESGANRNGDEVEGDDATDERNLFGEERSTAVGLVASRMGVLRVELAPDRVGGFGMVDRRGATDVATNGRTVVGTDEDVLLDAGTGTFESLGFGPAATVGVDGGSVLVASPDGRIGRASIDGTDGTATEWGTVGTVADPHRFDGDLVATADGVVRVGDGLDSLGLREVTDVARGDGPDTAVLLAGTPDGLYRYEGGDWVPVLEMPVRRVSVAGGDRFVVTEDGRLFRHEGGSWEQLSLPEGKTAFEVAHGESVYVVTANGEMLIAAESGATSDGFEGWHTQPLGVRDVTGFVLQTG